MKKTAYLQDVLMLANKVIRKRKIVLFNSYPAYSDNSKALYEYIINNRPDIAKKYRIIWGQEKGAVIPKDMKQYEIEAVDKKSLRGIFTFLSAKYVFSTHG